MPGRIRQGEMRQDQAGSSRAPPKCTTPRSAHHTRSAYHTRSAHCLQGLAAGPYGNPDRYAAPELPGDPGTGSWERTVGIYRTAFTWVVQASNSLEDRLACVVWWGTADAAKTTFVPVMVSMGDP